MDLAGLSAGQPLRVTDGTRDDGHNRDAVTRSVAGRQRRRRHAAAASAADATIRGGVDRGVRVAPGVRCSEDGGGIDRRGTRPSKRRRSPSSYQQQQQEQQQQRGSGGRRRYRRGGGEGTRRKTDDGLFDGSKTEDNNNYVDSDSYVGDDHRNRFAVKTVVVT